MSAYSDAVLADNPLGYWRLGDAVGPTAADSSGNGLDGTYANAPLLGQPSLIPTDGGNTAVVFDGINQEVVCGNDASLQITSGALECWVKTTDADAGIFDKPGAFNLYVAISNDLASFDYNAGTPRLSGVTLNDGQPHHIVLTFGVGTGQHYFDGAPVGAPFVYDVSSNIFDLEIATSPFAPSWIAATVDECAIYSTLSAARIAAHYLAATEAAAILAAQAGGRGVKLIDQIVGY